MIDSFPFILPKSGHVKLTKLFGHRVSDGALPFGYWLKGQLMRPLVAGEAIEVLRYERMGREGEPENVKIAGIFTSSLIKKIELANENPFVLELRTENSLWRMELLPALQNENYQGEGNIT